MPIDLWQIGGGTAEHSAKIGRTIAYLANGTKQGVSKAPHAAVDETDPTGPQVRVAPGVVRVNSTFGNAYFDQYVVRRDSISFVDVDPTGSSAGRSDLVIWEILDPYAQGSIHQEPADPVNGPYDIITIEPGVPSSTRSFAELGFSGRTAYALARIDIPASTATITAGMVTNLRNMADPIDGQDPGPDGDATITIPSDEAIDSSATSFIAWPPSAEWTVTIPERATKAKLTLSASGVLERVGDFVGDIRLTLVGVGSTQSYPIRTSWTGSVISGTLGPYELEFAVPKSFRGTTQTVQMEGRWRSGDGELAIDAESTVTLHVEFVERPELPNWADVLAGLFS